MNWVDKRKDLSQLWCVNQLCNWLAVVTVDERV